MKQNTVTFIIITILIASLLTVPIAYSYPARALFLDKIYDTPDYMQTDQEYGGLPGGGTQYCGPVSVSNSLMWLSDNGFPDLAPHSSDRKKDQFDVAYLLGSSAYMDTSLTDGTGLNNLCTGLKQYILDAGYTYDRLESQGWRYVSSEFDNGQDIPDMNWVRHGIEGYGSVWLNIGWYIYNATTNTYTRTGGHWITLVGYGHDGISPNPDYLIAHDPASRAGTTFANEYILPVRIESGTLEGSYTGLPRSAVGFYKLTDGMHIKATADFAILDTVVVLEMSRAPQSVGGEGEIVAIAATTYLLILLAIASVGAALYIAFRGKLGYQKFI